MPDRAVHVRITGAVQGVSYRAWVQDRATRLGLSGWVRNLDSGEVEAVFCGPADAVDAMLLACRDGPPLAVVEDVEVLGPAEPTVGRFAIRS